jgi:hypothetical protein
MLMLGLHPSVAPAHRACDTIFSDVSLVQYEAAGQNGASGNCRLLFEKSHEATARAKTITSAMLLPRILAPVRASLSASVKTIAPSKSVLEALRATNGSTAPSATVTLPFVRYASHQTQGRANGAKDGPGKRLGAKKSGGAYMSHSKPGPQYS